MNKQQKSKQDVFDHFWNHFFIENNPLGYVEGKGCYYTKGCAIGYRMPPEWNRNAEDWGDFSEIPCDQQIAYFDTVGIRYDVGFAQALQQLHDYIARKYVQSIHEPYETLVNVFGIEMPKGALGIIQEKMSRLEQSNNP